MDWIYLSPHFDDVALSLGGLLWEQSQAGERVSVWTLCGGYPPTGGFSAFAEGLHARWGTGPEAITTRREEDRVSCERMGAAHLHFEIPDCIYRRSPQTGEFLYASEEALWVPVHPDEAPLVEEICRQMRARLPEGAQVVCPLTLGNHVDHRLTRAAAEKLGIPLKYYADYPYVLDVESPWAPANFEIARHALSPAALTAWEAAIAAHQSQISTFWPSLAEMRAAIRAFYDQMAGVVLLSPSP